MAAGIHRLTKCLQERPPVVLEFFFLCKRVSGGTSSCVTLVFQHHMFNMEYRHLLNVSVQNTLDYISENFNQKFFPLRSMHPKLPRKVRRSQF